MNDAFARGKSWAVVIVRVGARALLDAAAMKRTSLLSTSLLSTSLLSIACLAGVTALFATGCSTSTATDDPSSSEADLVNAPVDTKNTWSVGICASEPNTDPAKGAIGACVVPKTRCSGALVAPNLVLTARHCVHDIDYSQATGFCTGAKFGAPLGAGKVRVTLDASVLGENVAWRDVVEVITPADDNACKGDIVLLRLAADVAAADATPIALDVRPLAAHHPRSLAVVGRGILTSLVDLSTGAPLDENVDGGLKRRFKTDIPWTCVSNQPNRPCKVVDFSSPPTNEFELPLDAYFAFGPGTSSGDSGAAILSSSKFKSGKMVAVGVNSAGTFDQNGVGNHGLGVRLDVHEAWLTSTLATKGQGKGTLITSASPPDGDE